jgi:hypothetical protein
MDRDRIGQDDSAFNAHTGAAFGLIIGIILGSLLLNAPSVSAPDGLQDKLRSAMLEVVTSIAQAPSRLGS